MNQNIVKKVCKELGITQKELAKIGSNLMLENFIKFEKSIKLEEAYKYLLIVKDLIEIAENEKLFPISLNNLQNETQREIFYPNIKLDILNAIYTIENIPNFIKLINSPQKQTELVKYLKTIDLNYEKIKNGIWFLSEYGYFKRWKEKNRVYLQINDKLLKGLFYDNPLSKG